MEILSDKARNIMKITSPTGHAIKILLDFAISRDDTLPNDVYLSLITEDMVVLQIFLDL